MLTFVVYLLTAYVFLLPFNEDFILLVWTKLTCLHLVFILTKRPPLRSGKFRRFSRKRIDERSTGLLSCFTGPSPECTDDESVDGCLLYLGNGAVCTVRVCYVVVVRPEADQVRWPPVVKGRETRYVFPRDFTSGCKFKETVFTVSKCRLISW